MVKISHKEYEELGLIMESQYEKPIRLSWRNKLEQADRLFWSSYKT